MHVKRFSVIAGVFGVCALGLMAWVFGAATGSASGQTAQRSAAKATNITVTLGKPSELGITLSKFSAIPAGTVVFKVTNKGKIAHDFKVCTATATVAKNTCTGKGIRMLKPGQSATLTLVMAKKGKYAYLCTVPGHAAGGMKGLLGVGVTAAAPKATAGTTTPGATTTTAAGGGAGGTGCAQPARVTDVSVGMLDFSFQMSRTTIPCGQVAFHTSNVGEADHNFTVLGVGAPGVGPVIHAGANADFTVALAPGGYDTICDVPTHAALGMTGRITITA